MRVDPAVFERLDLRAHSVLHDVPLHDAWRVDLPSRERPCDMRDVQRLFSEASLGSLNVVVRGLFALRRFLGRLFGWDDAPRTAPKESFASRLTDEDREKSLVPEGRREGPFRVLYVFENEALSEVINRTVHAFSCMALVPNESGYSLYWAIYVRPGNVLSRLYMALIDPFRHWVVYPSILGRAQRAWSRA